MEMKVRVVPRAPLARSGRMKPFTFAILLCALIVSTALLAAFPSFVRGTISPGSLPSWNPAVSCRALLTTIEGVIGSQANSNGGATYAGGGFLPGIPDKRSTSPPCTVNGNATFVEIHGIELPSYTSEDCVAYPNGTFCDSTANVLDPNCASSDVYLCRIHVEIDQAWKSAGIAPQNPPSTTQLFDIQGFVYWDPNSNDHFADQWHSYSGWELHALTAWRLSSGVTASFTYSPTSPSTGTQISFTATASGGTQPYSFSWSFGDGSTGTGSTVTHAYTNAGSYNVALTVKDSSSPQQTAASQQTVTVTSPPPPPLSAGFTFSPSSPQTGQQVTFTASASGGTTPYTFSWNFGDGSTGTGSSASHTYATAGTFTVTLTVKDSGSPQQTATSHQSVTVTSPPPPALTASFTFSPANPQVGQAVSFTASASGGTQPYAYSWTFGDGGIGSGSSVTHSYQAAGSYNVVLTVIDAGGQTAKSTQTVTVSNPPPPTLTASFSYTPASPSVGQLVTFTASASGGTAPYSFSWSFGDGSIDSGSTVTHVYSSAGTFNVILVVSDGGSPQQTANSQKSVTVTSPPPPPLTTSFSYSPTSPQVGQQVTFSGSASGGTSPYTFSWNFGDGTSAGTGATTTHTYSSAGTFNVILAVSDSGSPQQTSSSQNSITVTSPPPSLAVNFAFNPSSPEAGQPVTFTASAS
ncbi:PKD domain-containing protein, partial [Candidatus Bathyarchaeota archaeon]